MITLTVHVQELLNDPVLTRSIAMSHKDVERVLIQAALDTVSEGNVETVAPTLLGIKHVQDILLLFKAKGDVIISKENKQNASTSK